jgi:hypothetical protein
MSATAEERAQEIDQQVSNLHSCEGAAAEHAHAARPPSAREIGAILGLSYAARLRRLMRNTLCSNKLNATWHNALR